MFLIKADGRRYAELTGRIVVRVMNGVKWHPTSA